MKIVTYNVNGLRARVSASRSLRAFLDALDADIICIQETKLARQELTADVAVADGYESFFSCTRTVKKGRIGYSGVATFCRTRSPTDVALPVAAEEGFTGLLRNSDEPWLESHERYMPFEGFTRQELFELDSEGRCIVTDHTHFVLFNIYGPNAGGGDSARQDFKLNFFRALQIRLESILKQRRVILVGDLNISPYAVDSCDPGPDFDVNPSRKWLRTLLQSEFADVFRQLHPDRKDAYTCWSQATGAEEFNYGTRIDLILAAGPCTGSCDNGEMCSARFSVCGIESCEILHGLRRSKSDSLPRWAGGRRLKLEGSDHVPVFTKLKPLPPLPSHEVPQSAARFLPGLRGRQQTIVSIFQKFGSKSFSEDRTISGENRQSVKTSLTQSSLRTFCLKRKSTKTENAHVNIAAQHIASTSGAGDGDSLQKSSGRAASEEWERLKQMMTRIPLCKGHAEPCIVRYVKKPGPNMGRAFYVCARAKGPASNPEARCDHFEWTSGIGKRRK